MKKILIDIFNIVFGISLVVGALYVGFNFTKSDSKYHQEWKERRENTKNQEIKSPL